MRRCIHPRWAWLPALLALGCQSRRDEKVMVFAAMSLREAFSSLAEELRASHPAVAVSFNFAASQELRTQIEHGAPADVFASADVRLMTELYERHEVGPPQVFARNEPVIVVAKERATTIRSLEDLPAAERIVLGAPDVPIGQYTSQILDRAAAELGADFRARVEAKVISRELNVKQVLAKVTLGEADAGVVYRSDVTLVRDQVAIVTIPPDLNVTAEYPIAIVSDTKHEALARTWLALVLSSRGQAVLAQAGFSAAGPRGAGSP